MSFYFNIPKTDFPEDFVVKAYKFYCEKESLVPEKRDIDALSKTDITDLINRENITICPHAQGLLKMKIVEGDDYYRVFCDPKFFKKIGAEQGFKKELLKFLNQYCSKKRN